MTATVTPLRPLRDATEAELHVEPDCVLHALADGEIRATGTTRALAVFILELRRRRLLVQVEREVYPPLAAVIAEAYAPRRTRRLRLLRGGSR